MNEKLEKEYEELKKYQHSFCKKYGSWQSCGTNFVLENAVFEIFCTLQSYHPETFEKLMNELKLKEK